MDPRHRPTRPAHAGPGGRPRALVPTRAQAIWHLPAGDFVYADFQADPAQVAFNVSASR